LSDVLRDLLAAELVVALERPEQPREHAGGRTPRLAPAVERLADLRQVRVSLPLDIGEDPGRVRDVVQPCRAIGLVVIDGVVIDTRGLVHEGRRLTEDVDIGEVAAAQIDVRCARRRKRVFAAAAGDVRALDAFDAGAPRRGPGRRGFLGDADVLAVCDLG
jgi:hypothetical protein